MQPPSVPLSRRHFNGMAAACAIALGSAAAGCASPAHTPRKSGMVTVGDGQLYYEEAGEGPAVVLVHGFTLDTRMWDDQFDVLARNHRVVRYDLRGFGRSSLPKGPYGHADDCLALMQSLGIAKATVIGLSAGGRIAIDLAVRHPSAVTRLVAIDTFVGGYVTTQGYRDAFNAMIAAARAGDMAKAKSLWLAHPLFIPANEQPAVVARLKQMVDTYSGFHWASANPEVPLSPPAVNGLASLRVPFLVIVGERDIEDVQAMTNLLAREIPGAQKVTIPRIGHMSNMEAPQQVNAALLKFLRA